jgi:hypothetical protein
VVKLAVEYSQTKMTTEDRDIIVGHHGRDVPEGLLEAVRGTRAEIEKIYEARLRINVRAVESHIPNMEEFRPRVMEEGNTKQGRKQIRSTLLA